MSAPHTAAPPSAKGEAVGETGPPPRLIDPLAGIRIPRGIHQVKLEAAWWGTRYVGQVRFVSFEIRPVGRVPTGAQGPHDPRDAKG